MCGSMQRGAGVPKSPPGLASVPGVVTGSPTCSLTEFGVAPTHTPLTTGGRGVDLSKPFGRFLAPPTSTVICGRGWTSPCVVLLEWLSGVVRIVPMSVCGIRSEF